MGFQGDSSPLGLELRKLQLYLTVHKQPLDQKAFKDSNDRAPSLPALQFYYYQILNWRRHPDKYIQDCSRQLGSGIESRKKAIESTLLASIQNICEGLLYSTLTQEQLAAEIQRILGLLPGSRPSNQDQGVVETRKSSLRDLFASRKSASLGHRRNELIGRRASQLYGVTSHELAKRHNP